MKSLLLLFLLLLYPSTSFAEIDERKTDVYFANGISTSIVDAATNADLLEETIRSQIYAGNIAEYEKHIAKVTTAYNSTHSFLGITGGLDAIETMYQK